MQPLPAATAKDDGLGEGITTPLAEKATEYILDQHDDAAQEDRWRTIMKRDITKSFRKLETNMQAQREEIRKEVQGRLDDVLSKLDQLVETRATDHPTDARG